MASWEMSLRVAEAPKQAIELLAEAAARCVPYDLAVVDLGTTGTEALELARTIRARADIGKVRLVMLTRRPIDIQHAQEAGFNACLVKPVRQTVLYECMVNIMAGRPQEAAAAPAMAKPAAAPTEVGGSILLVEDNVINQQVALGILQIRGYSVTVVSNGREALEAHGQGAFDLILMDCHMPEMDGFEATREIRRREKTAKSNRIPIVALTANAMARDREECLNAGMDDHLSKPFNMLALQEMLDRWMPKGAAKQAQASQLAARATAKAAEVLDRQVLDQLGKVVTNGKPELLARVIKTYLAESPKLIRKLQEAARKGDTAQIAASAHALKSCSANLGATVLSRYCDDVEASARAADTEAARRIVTQIESEHGSVQSALSSEFKTLAASQA
jgi:CheY-like chemotaxis protein